MDPAAGRCSHTSPSAVPNIKKSRAADVARERNELPEVKDWTSVSFDEARTVLRQWRDEHVRRSEETVELWEYVLSRYPRSLGDELWLIYEQIGEGSCCALIKTDGEAFRYESALVMYEQLIESDPTNMSYRKRRIAVLKVQGERQEAIKEMNDYLRTFLNDNEAWLELSQLYLHEGDYVRAAHCLEELILANPHNSLYLRRLAEVRYAQGGQENVELAKVYFEHAIRTNPSCSRSLFGLLLSCNWLAQKTSGQRKRDLVHCGLTAIEKLLQRYRETEQEGTNPNVESQIEALLNMKGTLQS